MERNGWRILIRDERSENYTGKAGGVAQHFPWRSVDDGRRAILWHRVALGTTYSILDLESMHG